MVKNNRNDSFDGKAIRAARKKMHLSQVELAEGITTQATISLVENQNRVPNADVLLAILDRLNLDISEFVSGDFLTQKAKELLGKVVLEMKHDALSEFAEFEKALSQNDILKSFAIIRFINPKALIRLAGGRNMIDKQGENCFNAGANATITGNYLTSTGNKIVDDMKMVKELKMTVRTTVRTEF